MMTCSELVAAYLSSLNKKFACTIQPNGRLCLVTPYVYPDHDNVEIFVRERPDGIVVSDLERSEKMMKMPRFSVFPFILSERS